MKDRFFLLIDKVDRDGRPVTKVQALGDRGREWTDNLIRFLLSRPYVRRVRKLYVVEDHQGGVDISWSYNEGDIPDAEDFSDLV